MAADAIKSAWVSNNTFQQLPVEILVAILDRVDDERDLLNVEATSKRLSAVIREGTVFKRRCRRLLATNCDLISAFRFHGFDSKSVDATFCKRFLFKLRRLAWPKSDLRLDHDDGVKVNVLDCEGLMKDTLDTAEWRRRHNYTGVYDMALDSANSVLVVSVYNIIQVWNVDSYECVNVIGPEALDDDAKKSSCFFASGRVLACGTDVGIIKTLDLFSGKLLGVFKHNSDCISDLRIVGETLFAVTWVGDLQEWRLNGAELVFFKETRPEVPESVQVEYQRRNWERLVDFNDKLVATNSSALFVIIGRKDAFSISVQTTARVLCCKVFDDWAYWGQQHGQIFRVRGRKSAQNAVLVDKPKPIVVTPYGDNITSIDVDAKRVVFGDVNAEIHVCLVENLDDDACKESPDFLIETGHRYGAYVWSVAIDATRIFSGDSDGKLVVHDFWNYADD